IGLVATVTRSQVPATSVTNDDARWKELLKQLASEDFRTRDGAQKVLGKSTWRDLAALRRLAEGAADEEVKARLAQRVTEIEDEIAVNPPPVSLDIKDASVSEMTDALSQAMGIPMDGIPINGPRTDKTFTLSVKEQPFWEVFLELSRQHGLSLP